MKILQINKFFYLKGGSEKYFFELRNLLKKNNHQVIDFSMKDKKNLPSPFSKYFIEPMNLGEPVSLKRPDLLFKKMLKLIWNKEARKKLEILIKKEKPDIVHIHNIHHEISLSILPVLKKYKIPVVQTLHDYQVICPNYKLYSQGKICEKCKRHKYYQCFLNRCVRNSYLASLFGTLENYFYWFSGIYDRIDIFIAPSKFLKNKFIEFGIPENKIVYLPNFVKIFSKSENLSQNNYLLYFGRLSKEKGVDVLIKAMQFVDKNIKLKIVGNGPEKENLKKLAEKLKINNQIEFFGYKNQDELKEIIKNSLAVVVPSRWYENCPLSILEAFSFSKPVIASNLGGIPELIKNREIGFLFKPGNAKDLAEKINSLLEGDTTSCRLQDKLNSMGKSAQEEIEKKYNPEIHYQKLMEIYQKLK
jgi:glycosyltransferase involved in cell wall biosynthesis